MSLKKKIRLGKMTGGDLLLYVDTTASAVQGKIRGWEDLKNFNVKVINLVDGLILNFGQYAQNYPFFGARNSAVTGIRADWTDYKRKKYSFLERNSINHEFLFAPDAIDFVGADFCSVYFLIGLTDSLETKEMKNIARVVQSAHKASLPVFVEIIPVGEKITDHNLDGAIQLALSMCLEMGIDFFCIPPLRGDVLESIKGFIRMPLLIKINTAEEEETYSILENSLPHCDGFVLGEKFFSNNNFIEVIQNLKKGIPGRESIIEQQEKNKTKPHF